MSGEEASHDRPDYAQGVPIAVLAGGGMILGSEPIARSLRSLLFAGLVLLWQAGAAGAVVSQTFDAHGVDIHYLIDGAGEPVVLIHGSIPVPGSTGSCREPLPHWPKATRSSPSTYRDMADRTGPALRRPMVCNGSKTLFYCSTG